MARKQLSVLALTTLAMALPGGKAARGADWLGGTGNWSDGTMWSTGSAPASGTVLIDDGNPTNSVVTITSTTGGGVFPAISATIDAGDTLQVQSAALNAPSITVNGSLQTSGTTVSLGYGNAGGLALTGTGTVTFGATTTTFDLFSSGTPSAQILSIASGLTLSGPFNAAVSPSRGLWMTNSGHVTVDGPGKAVTMSGSSLGTTRSQNFGTIEATNGANLNLTLIQNQAGGTISVSGGGTLNWAPISGPAAANLGTINIDHATLNFAAPVDPARLDGTVNLNGGTIKNSAISWSLVNGALLQGTGTIETVAGGSFGVGTMAGTVSPGGAAGTGTITFTGQCTFAAGGHYACGLGAGGASDLLAVGTSMDLTSADDYLDLSHLPGATPNVPYLIATYALPPDERNPTLFGVFDHVTPGYTVDYSVPGSIYVTLVPEPSAAVGLGAVAVAGIMRRRRGSR